MTTMSSKKILVVDDDSNFLKLIRMRLELAGHEVITALNEDEAMAKAREETFVLSIVDLKLVHSDGISLMRELHSINPYMPVIVLTAHGSIEFTKGNVSNAADLAGKYRADFYNLVKTHNLNPEGFKSLDKEK